MKFFSADDYGAYGRAKEETTRGEASRFFALAQADAASRERATASANEADRFAFQAAVQDARAMEDRNRFDLQQANQRSDAEFNRSLMLSQEDRAKEQAKLKREESAFNRKLAEDDERLRVLEDESIGSSIADSLAAAEQSRSAQQAAFKQALLDHAEAKGALTAAGFTFRGNNFSRPNPNLNPMMSEAEKKKLAETHAALEKDYINAEAVLRDAKSQFDIALKNASEVRTSAIRNQMFPGQGVVTSGRTGKKYSFGPPMGAPADSGGLNMQNVTQVGWVGPQERELANPFRVPGATPPPVARQTDEEFGPPAPVSPIVARQSATQVPPAAAERPRQYTGFVPAAYRAAGAGLKGAANYGIVLPIRTAVQSLPRMSGALIDAARATGDFLVMPPEGSDEYLVMMARRALEDRNRQRITQAFDEFAPRYMR